MTIAPGTRLGFFDVVGLLGAGGPAVARAITARELWRGLAEAPLARAPW